MRQEHTTANKITHLGPTRAAMWECHRLTFTNSAGTGCLRAAKTDKSSREAWYLQRTQTHNHHEQVVEKNREKDTQRERGGGDITGKPVKRNIPGDVAAGEQVIIQLLQALLGIQISELYSHCRQSSRAQRELLQTNGLQKNGLERRSSLQRVGNGSDGGLRLRLLHLAPPSFLGFFCGQGQSKINCPSWKFPKSPSTRGFFFLVFSPSILWYRKFGKSKIIRTTHFSNFFPILPFISWILLRARAV
jgi:hypothetical protein